MMETRRDRATLGVLISTALALVLFLGALDLHSPKLFATLATLTPVLCSGHGSTPLEHAEAPADELVPDHSPLLLKSPKTLPRPCLSSVAVAQRPRCGRLVEVQPRALPALQLFVRLAPLRAPPLSVPA